MGPALQLEYFNSAYFWAQYLSLDVPPDKLKEVLESTKSIHYSHRSCSSLLSEEDTQKLSVGDVLIWKPPSDIKETKASKLRKIFKGPFIVLEIEKLRYNGYEYYLKLDGATGLFPVNWFLRVRFHP